MDFAGGTVVHISSGVSALVCAMLLGKRLGYGSEPMPPHNLTYTAIGATMLWVGWFGFNAGSALKADGLAASAFAATHLAAAAGGLTWAAMEWIFRGKPTHPGHLLRRGGRPGLHYAGLRLRHAQLGPADGRGRGRGLLPGLHGAEVAVQAMTIRWTPSACTAWAGRWARSSPGVFATRATGALDSPATSCWGCSKAARCWKAQLVAVAITWGLAIVGTFDPLRCSTPRWACGSRARRRIEGLDFSQHGEEGYIFI